MKPVHFYASHRHYVDHLAPLWHALEPHERGTFYVGSQDAHVRARHHRITPDPRNWRQMPPAHRTLLGRYQPVVAVASLRDHRAAAPRATVYVEHGAGQTYTGDGTKPDNHGPGGPGKRRVRLFVNPNGLVAALNRRVYPEAAHVVAGNLRLDAWAPGWQVRQAMARADVTRPTVAFSFRWENTMRPDQPPEQRSAWSHWVHAVMALAHTGEYRILGHGHPRAWAQLAPWWSRLGVPLESDPDRVFTQCDVLVADNTSLLYEYAATGRPVVLLDAPWYRRDVEHGLRFWRCADVGLHAASGEPAELRLKIADTLSDDPQAERRAQITAEVFAPIDGCAAQRAAQAMREHLP